eukprot:GFYU01017648.1.p1 GENE.GFYU01017648.1~~GFYU01017648.1.p1  ORF type:complete len:539 (-),score=128.43 GFYU01017648.1:74-1690(-)
MSSTHTHTHQTLSHTHTYANEHVHAHAHAHRTRATHSTLTAALSLRQTEITLPSDHIMLPTSSKTNPSLMRRGLRCFGHTSWKQPREIIFFGTIVCVGALLMLWNSSMIRGTRGVDHSGRALDRDATCLTQWVDECNLVPYPRGGGFHSLPDSKKPLVAVYIPFPVDNVYWKWEDVQLDTEDFEECSTRCIWVHDGLWDFKQTNKECFERAEAAFFWPIQAFSLNATIVEQDYNVTKRDHQTWALWHTEPEQSRDKLFTFDIVMSFFYGAHIPATFFLNDYSYYTEPQVSFEEKTYDVVMLHKNCDGYLYDRVSMWKELMDALPPGVMKSPFKCLHNHDLSAMENSRQNLKKAALWLGAEDYVDDTFESIVRHAKFFVAFENTLQDDYMSEKIWQAIHLGAIPIYYGASNAAQYIPKDSFVDVRAFDNMQEVAKTVTTAISDKETYERYHAFRYRGADHPDNRHFAHVLKTRGNSEVFMYNRLIAGNRKRMTCDLCEYIYKHRKNQDAWKSHMCPVNHATASRRQETARSGKQMRGSP